MFPLTYGFFDYKYQIPGYSGWDFDHGPAQAIYDGVALALILLALILTRKTPREKLPRLIGCIGIVMVISYLIKVAWETVHDIQAGDSFNWYLLPLDTCAFIMPATLLYGFAKGRVQRAAGAWIATGGLLGGIGAMVNLTAFHYFPFFTYGAFYSMIRHAVIVFLGLWMIVKTPAPLRFSTVLDGMAFHLACSAVVIPLDYIFGWDFMFYRAMSSIPVFDGVAEKMIDGGLWFLVPLVMLALYFACFCVIWGTAALVKNRLLRRSPA